MGHVFHPHVVSFCHKCLIFKWAQNPILSWPELRRFFFHQVSKEATKHLNLFSRASLLLNLFNPESWKRKRTEWRVKIFWKKTPMDALNERKEQVKKENETRQLKIRKTITISVLKLQYWYIDEPKRWARILFWIFWSSGLEITL